jgi:hypothetical protein
MSDSLGDKGDEDHPTTTASPVVPAGCDAAHDRFEKITKCNSYDGRAHSRGPAGADTRPLSKTPSNDYE